MLQHWSPKLTVFFAIFQGINKLVQYKKFKIFILPNFVQRTKLSLSHEPVKASNKSSLSDVFHFVWLVGKDVYLFTYLHLKNELLYNLP